MTDLTTFLRARLDEDEQAALATKHPSYAWRNFDMDGELRDSKNAGTVAYIPHAADRDHIARWDPARVLAEVDAKRRQLDAFDEYGTHDTWDLIDTTLRLLAIPYAGHPDYQKEWAP